MANQAPHKVQSKSRHPSLAHPTTKDLDTNNQNYLHTFFHNKTCLHTYLLSRPSFIHEHRVTLYIFRTDSAPHKHTDDAPSAPRPPPATSRRRGRKRRSGGRPPVPLRGACARRSLARTASGRCLDAESRGMVLSHAHTHAHTHTHTRTHTHRAT